MNGTGLVSGKHEPTNFGYPPYSVPDSPDSPSGVSDNNKKSTNDKEKRTTRYTDCAVHNIATFFFH